MNASSVPFPAAQHTAAAAISDRALRKLFLTLFLRGRSSRGLSKQGAPRSLRRKLAITLLFYALFGLFSLSFLGQSLETLSTYLHSATFAFVAMFVAASSGEILFNKEEADILLHRPVAPRALLRAKIAVLVQVSLWLAGAFNAVGFVVGTLAPAGSWRYPLAHALSITLEALFCTGCVVLAYQLCLRWFGRERLEGLLTTVQVFVAIALVLTAQLLPRMALRLDTWQTPTWWIAMPPAWFAAVDDAMAGSGSPLSWILATWSLLATSAILWLASDRLARHYTTGLQLLTVTSAARPKQTVRRWLALADAPPLRWCLRHPAERAAFVLAFAYVLRSREVKLRLYPSIAPLLIVPILLLLQPRGMDGFIVAFAGNFLGMVPMLTVRLLRYCEHWQAADIFRLVPIAGPGQLCGGVRTAVITLSVPPLVLFVAVLAWLLPASPSNLPLLLPGVVLLPLYAMIPCLKGEAVPLSCPAEDARSAGRGLLMMGIMLASMLIAFLAAWAKGSGHFWGFMLIELPLVVILYLVMRRSIAATPWPSME